MTDEHPVPVAGQTGSSLWAVMRRRAFAALWAGQLSGVVGDSFNYVAISWLVLHLTDSSLALGSVLVAAAVPRAVLLPLGGVVNDRVSPRTTMIATGLARAVVVAVLALLATQRALTLPLLWAAAAVTGTLSAFYAPAPLTLLPQVVEPRQLEAANGAVQANQALGNVFGPALAGAVVAAWGAARALFGDAGGYLLAGLFPCLIRHAPRGASTRKPEPAGILSGVRLVWADIPLRAVFALIAAVNLVILGALEVGLPILAQRHFQGPAAFGAIFSVLGLGVTAGAVTAAGRPAPKRFGAFSLGGVVSMGLAIAVIAATLNLAATLLAMAWIGITIGVLNTYVLSFVQRRVPERMMGRVMALVMFAAAAVEPAGLALGGILAHSSLRLLLWLSASCLVLVAGAAATSRTVRLMTPTGSSQPEPEAPEAGTRPQTR